MSHDLQKGLLPVHYSRLLDSLGPGHPLRRTVLPLDDCTPAPGELADPLGEDEHTVCTGLIHTYPDKVLLLATLECAVRCQYCTRGRLLRAGNRRRETGVRSRGAGGRGQETGSNDWKKSWVQAPPASNDWKISNEVFQTLEKLTGVRDVLISGGDPLMLPNHELDQLIGRVRQIRHIRTVRMGSKIPAVMPERITPELAGILGTHRIWLQLHFIHPAELTPETMRALGRLAGAGVPMVSQTVLLKGINDNADTLADLFYGLLENRVKPYYLFQCDPVLGSSGFRTTVQKGLDLMKELQGRVSGLALPNFCIDAPGGGGKIVLPPDAALKRHGRFVVLKSFDGRLYRYPDAQ